MTLYIYLLVANILDVVTGFIYAIKTKTVKSSVMKNGILTKVLIWIVVSVSYILQDIVNIDLVKPTVIFYIFMEIVSILENTALYVPIPEQVKSILAKYHQPKGGLK